MEKKFYITNEPHFYGKEKMDLSFTHGMYKNNLKYR